MENYIVSARKYRPSTFRSVVGQSALTATLKNAVATGRLAHSYLFCGSRGVGKTSCARIFAKTINCQHPTPDGEACNECDSCKAFNAGTSMNIIELDAASNNGIDDMRSIIEQVQVPPAQGRYRVFIVDEVHMLSQAAFNSFLKTLEEPPSYVIFILATTEKHKIIPTILSRCQIYDFHRITVHDIIDHLAYVAKEEGISAEPAALNVIARKADGAMRDALSIFDQVAASSRGAITYQSAIDNLNVLDTSYYNRLLDCFLAGNVLESWMIYKEIRDKGFDSQFFINGLASYLRDLMAARDESTASLLEVSDDVASELRKRAAKCSPEFLYHAMSLCNDADLNYRIATGKQFLIELTLAKICQPLSPSRNNDGNREGQLKHIAPAATPAAPAQQPINTPATHVSTAPHPAPSSPEPTPVQAIAPASIPQVAAPSIPRHTHSIQVPKVSLRHGITREDNKSTASGATTPHALRTNAFSDEAVSTAWSTYIANHPTAHLLVNTMRASFPKRLGPTTLLITVENDIQLELLQRSTPELLEYLHDSLSNDEVTLEIAINQGAPSRRTLNDTELLATLCNEHPQLKKLIDDFGLRLS
jgi:DNA polymerase III, subunit gamma and tau